MFNIFSNPLDQYTRESGVRGLEKMLTKIIRNVAKSFAMKQSYNVNCSVDDINNILGLPKYDRATFFANDIAGVATGLAWTSVGGDILFVESSLSKGKGKLSITGNLGNIMKESAIIALEYLKSHLPVYH